MTIENEQQLENTRQKLRLVEERYERKRREPTDDEGVREVTLASLKKTINQLKEEIVQFEYRRSPAGENTLRENAAGQQIVGWDKRMQPHRREERSGRGDCDVIVAC